MTKIGEQIRFEQTVKYIQRQFTGLDKNLTEEKIEGLWPKFKDLDKSLKKIEESLMSDRRLNREDVRQKIANYKEEIGMMKRRLQDYALKLQKRNLMKRANSKGGEIQMQNMKNYQMLDALGQQTTGIDRDFQQTAGIVQNTRQALGQQRNNINTIQNQWQDADVELTVIDQFMRMISNRNLLTKLILVVLILFLGVADIIVLILKIS